MEPIRTDALQRKLNDWIGKLIYLHVEVNPGAYWRNGNAQLVKSHIKGDGPYRLFLELDERLGLLQMDDLTHMDIEDDMVICTGYDEADRIARTIELSCTPFPM